MCVCIYIYIYIYVLLFVVVSMDGRPRTLAMRRSMSRWSRPGNSSWAERHVRLFCVVFMSLLFMCCCVCVGVYIVYCVLLAYIVYCVFVVVAAGEQLQRETLSGLQARGGWYGGQGDMYMCMYMYM